MSLLDPLTRFIVIPVTLAFADSNVVISVELRASPTILMVLGVCLLILKVMSLIESSVLSRSVSIPNK